MAEHRPSTKKSYDTATLERLAIHYVARYATTAAKLRAYLDRKVRVRDSDETEEVDLDGIVAKIVEMGFVDDAAFAEMRAGALARRGYGARRVRAALDHAGVATEVAATAINNGPITAIEAAHLFAKRKRIGPYSEQAPTPEMRRRAVSTMLRAGHDYADVRAILAQWYTDEGT